MNAQAVAMTADPLPDEPRSELGYARRFAHAYGTGCGMWPCGGAGVVWDGQRWAADGTGQPARWDQSPGGSPATRWPSPTVGAENLVPVMRTGDIR